MYRKISFYDFQDAFNKSDMKDNFTYEGQKALFEYLEQIEEDTGVAIELDIIAICCEWQEYKDLAAIQVDYPYKIGRAHV